MKGLGEAAASQPLTKQHGWNSRDVRLLASSQIGILGIVMGTFFYSSLMPALEADMSTSWSAADTRSLATLANTAAMLGLFAAGPLADYVRPSTLLGCNGVVVCSGMLLFAMTTRPYHAMAVVCMLTFMRGVMWPAANVLFVANLPSSKHDSAFLSSAFGSRIGDVIGPALISICLVALSFSWRGSVAVLLAAVMLCFAISIGVAPQHLKQPEAREAFTFEGLVQKTARLVTDVDGWLVFTSNLGTYAVWSLYDYVAVLTSDMYNLSPGQAAGANVYMSLGSAIGLGVAFFATATVGVSWGRAVHVLQSALSAAALGLLASRQLSLVITHTLLFLVGFGFVAIAYVPFMIYAARSRADERAFRTAVVDGMGQLCSVGFSYMYGTLRTEQGHLGVSKIFLFAAVSMGAATVTLAIYYKRLGLQEQREVCAPAGP